MQLRILNCTKIPVQLHTRKHPWTIASCIESFSDLWTPRRFKSENVNLAQFKVRQLKNLRFTEKLSRDFEAGNSKDSPWADTALSAPQQIIILTSCFSQPCIRTILSIKRIHYLIKLLNNRFPWNRDAPSSHLLKLCSTSGIIDSALLRDKSWCN